MFAGWSGLRRRGMLCVDLQGPSRRRRPSKILCDYRRAAHTSTDTASGIAHVCNIRLPSHQQRRRV
ncbi:MAG: hypothetical protein E6G35_09780 [Actinobacteria bacterium]|nr:MAG: hypothetical protein E6G35_09780 [Actinomycetota bacterium]